MQCGPILACKDTSSGAGLAAICNRGTAMNILSRLKWSILRIPIPCLLALAIAACASTDGTRPVGLTVSKNMHPPGTIPR